MRTDERVEDLLAAGASRVIVGTRALEERDWLAELAHRHPHELIVACDVRERRVTTRGWAPTRSSATPAAWPVSPAGSSTAGSTSAVPWMGRGGSIAPGRAVSS